ncbi:helix-turn-helix transcriptional regulator [Oceanisphaera ostreae]|uniref:Helix-turn-helix transcriptional regulator n=1 Tax=Oceanisphaera ostreae TaxID=914151 RepID=A0ABW3KIQ8_9GAMM
MANPTSTTFIKLPAVKERTSLSTSEIYRRIEAGTFPTQVKLGAKAVAWLEHEINDWINQTITAGRPTTNNVEA